MRRRPGPCRYSISVVRRARSHARSGTEGHPTYPFQLAMRSIRTGGGGVAGVSTPSRCKELPVPGIVAGGGDAGGMGEFGRSSPTGGAGGATQTAAGGGGTITGATHRAQGGGQHGQNTRRKNRRTGPTRQGSQHGSYCETTGRVQQTGSAITSPAVANGTAVSAKSAQDRLRARIEDMVGLLG